MKYYPKIVWLVFVICLLMGNQAMGAGKAANVSLPENMTFLEFLKTAMTPTGLNQQQKMARVNALANKKITVILPDNQGSFTGVYEPTRTVEIYYQNNRYYEKNEKLTGYLNINYYGNSEEWNLSPDQIIKSIKADPDMKLVKLGTWGNKHPFDYYRLECKGRIPALLYWEPTSYDERMHVRELSLKNDMPTDKKALEKYLSGGFLTSPGK